MITVRDENWHRSEWMFNVRPMLWIVVLAAIGGCAENGGSTSAKFMDIEVGMTKNEVVAILGEPSKKETQGSTEFLIYPAGGGDDVNFFPIAIVDGRVTGLGRNLYDTVVRAKAQSELDGEQRPRVSKSAN